MGTLCLTKARNTRSMGIWGCDEKATMRDEGREGHCGGLAVAIGASIFARSWLRGARIVQGRREKVLEARSTLCESYGRPLRQNFGRCSSRWMVTYPVAVDLRAIFNDPRRLDGSFRLEGLEALCCGAAGRWALSRTTVLEV
jgi:hypothetical protein